MGLYERLIEEKEEEERRRGSYSPVLSILLANAPEDRPKKYGADLRKLHRYIRRGVHSPGAGMHFASLKATYCREYGELKAEAQGQGELR